VKIKSAGPFWPGVFASIVRKILVGGDFARLEIRIAGRPQREADQIRHLRELLIDRRTDAAVTSYIVHAQGQRLVDAARRLQACSKLGGLPGLHPRIVDASGDQHGRILDAFLDVPLRTYRVQRGEAGRGRCTAEFR
jgi:hypothetical protein